MNGNVLCKFLNKRQIFQLNYTEHALFVFSSCGIECSRHFNQKQFRSSLTNRLQSQKFCFS